MTSFSLVQKRIQELLGELKSLHIVEAHVDEISQQLNDAYKELKKLDTTLDQELKDISALEKVSVKSLFYKTLGSKEQQLEKERQEYLEANLKYKEYKNSVELMEYEKGLLQKKLNGLPTLEKELIKLKEKRKAEILSSSDINLKNEFSDVLRKIDLNTILKKELLEAIEEGEKSVKMLNVVISFLQKARQWGSWGHQGSRRRGSYMKHQSIDKALKNLHVAQHHLNLFSRELRDLGENNVKFNINMAHFNKFTDFFFDNLISDWIIQQRIKSTLANIESTKSHVSRIVLNLGEELKQNKANNIELNKLKDEILTS